jgi:hypothetical protein
MYTADVLTMPASAIFALVKKIIDFWGESGARIAYAMEHSQPMTWKRTEDTQEEPSGEKPRVALDQTLHDRGETEEHHVACEPCVRREFLHLGQYKQTAGDLA